MKKIYSLILLCGVMLPLCGSIPPKKLFASNFRNDRTQSATTGKRTADQAELTVDPVATQVSFSTATFTTDIPEAVSSTVGVEEVVVTGSVNADAEPKKLIYFYISQKNNTSKKQESMPALINDEDCFFTTTKENEGPLGQKIQTKLEITKRMIDEIKANRPETVSSNTPKIVSSKKKIKLAFFYINPTNGIARYQDYFPELRGDGDFSITTSEKNKKKYSLCLGCVRS